MKTDHDEPLVRHVVKYQCADGTIHNCIIVGTEEQLRDDEYVLTLCMRLIAGGTDDA